MSAITLAFDVLGSENRVELTDFHAIVAGYTGRDAHAVQHHIDELAAIGIAPPPAVPMFYSVPASLFDNTGRNSTGGQSFTSGEIEPLYVRHAGRYYLGVGSDHTDRDLERTDIGDSKRACPKPVSRVLIEVPDLQSFSLDDAVASCWVDGRIYQQGILSGIRTPANVVGLLLERESIGDDDFVCLGGTLPLLNGDFVDGDEWRIALHLPDGGHLEHTYSTKGITI